MAGKKLQGQVAIITGAGRGIGAATAALLAGLGAVVVLAARSEEEIEGVARELRRAGGRALAVPCDVSDLAQVEEVVESALDQFDRIDMLVNNAATIWPMDEIVHTDPEEWAYAVHVNLIGAFNMIHNVLPLMLERGYGRIVNLSAEAAREPVAGWSAYCAAKAGLEMLSRTLALELQGSGVRVFTLQPDLVDTSLQADVRSVDTGESRLDFSPFIEAFEQGGLRPPAEVARAVAWLVGPWSRQAETEHFSMRDSAWLRQVTVDLGL